MSLSQAADVGNAGEDQDEQVVGQVSAPAAQTAPGALVQAGDGNESGYWLATRRLTLVLLMLWFGVTLLAAFFARELDFMLFGWPFGFWFGAQGALLLFLGIVAVYIWGMERLEAGATSER